MPRRILVTGGREDHCSIPDCTGLRYCRGWCKKHYSRWRRFGDPLKVLYIRDSVEKRFWQYVEKTDSCWLWTGALNAYGYGQFHIDGSPRMAHRVVYEWLVGPIPEGLQLDHVLANGCINRNCVKALADEFGPAHLEAVTPHENTLRSNSPTAVNAKKTLCPKGHLLSGKNLVVKPPGPGKPRGGRECRTCKNESRRVARA